MPEGSWLEIIKAYIDDLEARLTAARAGYLDELDFDLNARLGSPAGASLAADLLVINNFVDDLEGAVGAIEGATTLHNKLTAARAALLDQITALRLAELDAANLPTDVAEIDQKLAGLPTNPTQFVTTTTVKNASVTVHALDALGGTKRRVRVSFYLALDAAATFTPSWHKTRAGDLITFTKELIPAIATIATPAANGRYSYELGDIPEGCQGEFRIAQDNLGAATVALDSELTWEDD